MYTYPHHDAHLCSYDQHRSPLGRRTRSLSPLRAYDAEQGDRSATKRLRTNSTERPAFLDDLRYTSFYRHLESQDAAGDHDTSACSPLAYWEQRTPPSSSLATSSAIRERLRASLPPPSAVFPYLYQSGVPRRRTSDPLPPPNLAPDTLSKYRLVHATNSIAFPAYETPIQACSSGSLSALEPPGPHSHAPPMQALRPTRSSFSSYAPHQPKRRKSVHFADEVTKDLEQEGRVEAARAPRRKENKSGNHDRRAPTPPPSQSAKKSQDHVASAAAHIARGSSSRSEAMATASHYHIGQPRNPELFNTPRSGGQQVKGSSMKVSPGRSEPKVTSRTRVQGGQPKKHSGTKAKPWWRVWR